MPGNGAAPHVANSVIFSHEKNHGGESEHAENNEYDDIAPFFSQEKNSRTNAEHGNDETPATSANPITILTQAYVEIFEKGVTPHHYVEQLAVEERESIGSWLQQYYDAGVQAKNIARTVVQGFRAGSFAADGTSGFALAAFLFGVESDAKFELLNILGCAKE